MPKSKGRKRKRPPGSPKPTRTPSFGYRPGPIQVDEDELGRLLSQLGPEQLVVLGLPAWLLAIGVDQPANSCLETALLLRAAFAHFGVEAIPKMVELVVEDTRTGRRAGYGNAHPHFNAAGNFVGHAGAWLPDHQRFLDVTVQQFPGINTAIPTGGWAPVSLPLRLGWGPTITVPRGHLLLTYQPVAEHLHESILTHTQVIDNGHQAHRGGTNLATNFLQWLRVPEMQDTVAASPFPRLTALLAAIGDAPIDLDANNNFRVYLPGQPNGVFLDEVPIP